MLLLQLPQLLCSQTLTSLHSRRTPLLACVRGWRPSFCLVLMGFGHVAAFIDALTSEACTDLSSTYCIPHLCICKWMRTVLLSLSSWAFVTWPSLAMSAPQRIDVARPPEVCRGSGRVGQQPQCARAVLRANAGADALPRIHRHLRHISNALEGTQHKISCMFHPFLHGTITHFSPARQMC